MFDGQWVNGLMGQWAERLRGKFDLILKSPNPVALSSCAAPLFFILVLFVMFPQSSFSFNIPERFEYDLTWTGVKAGTAALEITRTGNEINIVSTAQSAKWVSVFYTVNDRAESILAKKSSLMFVGKPVNYRLKIREGRHRRDREVIFNSGNKVTYIDHINNERRNFDVPSLIFDPLSSFYYLRTLKLVVGEPVYITMFDSKKVWNVEVQVLRKEKVTLPTGAVDTILIKPLMKSEGIFYKKGAIYIWLTDDEKRIPVKLRTKVAVGSINAVLVGGRY
ncbi:MAG: DUF3108 domain-containing protein [Nitrospirae bacterium CG_4_10_14_3_um_filter_44_29]|nr:MAG: hypothetical protein COW90_07670 [Nitrospirae bacterium CG22_combo_CG10-13_8_21_14_all_44_11]PIV44332.1 MAG: DUF3108 domain-containing protein [Nitrospirae bacterium CG02_land_8_20_14_3_00_44_33]PIV67231.1 MAG: DUF3108 domain-containing protein [Nitrospirae bacterium CG01_land_8_20_14_3_00_44_22]PIW90428.1 MAG: DUF3108 domain-containing protein [Nitrospirae bacterium CG_4_8_14_3_um_filter_44_28]PIX89225.1 MAG: DUF3108 domain-containing protein [Nitrospirae bacterium CG_4_10_14_3_um_filt